MSPVDLERLLDRFSPSRREFMRTLLLGTAYATPMLASFSMDGLASPGMASGPNCSAAVASVIGPNQSDVGISKTASPVPAIAGSLLTYTVFVRNCNATGPAINVTWQDTLPANAAFVSAAQTAGAAAFTLTLPAVGSHGQAVSANAASMPASDTAVFQIVVKVDP